MTTKTHTSPDPKDYGPLYLVDGPLTGYGAPAGPVPAHRFRDAARAERCAARLNARTPGHVVIPGIGGRAGWRAL